MLRIRRWPGVVTIAAIAVAIGLLPLPYGYYMLLRLFLCGVCLYFLTRPHGVRDAEKWVLAGLVVLYNPIAPIELGSKPLWSIINVGTVVWFWMLDRRAAWHVAVVAVLRRWLQHRRCPQKRTLPRKRR